MIFRTYKLHKAKSVVMPILS